MGRGVTGRLVHTASGPAKDCCRTGPRRWRTSRESRNHRMLRRWESSNLAREATVHARRVMMLTPEATFSNINKG